MYSMLEGYYWYQKIYSGFKDFITITRQLLKISQQRFMLIPVYIYIQIDPWGHNQWSVCVYIYILVMTPWVTKSDSRFIPFYNTIAFHCWHPYVHSLIKQSMRTVDLAQEERSYIRSLFMWEISDSPLINTYVSP
jgi:hypothetical protein